EVGGLPAGRAALAGPRRGGRPVEARLLFVGERGIELRERRAGDEQRLARGPYSIFHSVEPRVRRLRTVARTGGVDVSEAVQGGGAQLRECRFLRLGRLDGLVDSRDHGVGDLGGLLACARTGGDAGAARHRGGLRPAAPSRTAIEAARWVQRA